MDAGNLRNFDPNALRRPDAGAAPGGAQGVAPRLDNAAFTTGVLLELADALTDDAAASRHAPAGNEAPPAARNGLLVNLSARALDAALPGRLPGETQASADYSHLRPGTAQPARSDEPLAPLAARPELALPSLPGRPEQANAPQVARPETPLAPHVPHVPRPEQLIAAQLPRPAPSVAPPPQTPEREAPRIPPSALRALAASEHGDLPSTLRPQPGDISPLGQPRVIAPGDSMRPDAFGQPEAAVAHAAAAAAAAQSALASVQPRIDGAPLIPRPVPEIMAAFFARSQTQSPIRLSIGRLVLAAAALAVVLLIVL